MHIDGFLLKVSCMAKCVHYDVAIYPALRY